MKDAENMLELVVKKACELDESEYKSCLHLNLQSAGLMRNALIEGYRNELKLDIILLKNKDCVILGWGMIKYQSVIPDFHVYVRQTHRQLGYGTMIMKKALEFTESKLRCYPTYSLSGRFYQNFERQLIYPNKHEKWMQL